MEIADITDALSLWRRLVSSAIDGAARPDLAVDAFRRVHRGGEAGAFDSALLLSSADTTRWNFSRFIRSADTIQIISDPTC